MRVKCSDCISPARAHICVHGTQNPDQNPDQNRERNTDITPIYQAWCIGLWLSVVGFWAVKGTENSSPSRFICLNPRDCLFAVSGVLVLQ